tara:strand:+ start:386 stop:601 length:216 start_codon:yes stop_codon:yes gene_type:complete
MRRNKEPSWNKTDEEPTTADKYNKEWINGIEHDKQIMLQELKKYFKLKFYNKVCEFRWEEIRRLFSMLKGR